MFPPNYFGPVAALSSGSSDAAAIASAVWSASERTITGATRSLPMTLAGIGPFALSHNGGVGAGGAAITIDGVPAGADRLRVVDLFGNPVAGATLRLYLASDATFANPIAAATTGSDGRWLAPVYCYSGSYQLVTSFTGEQSDQQSVVVP